MIFLMVNKYLKTLFALVALFFAVGAFGQNYPQPQNPHRIVNDFAGVFSASERDALEQKLRTFNDTTSTQIAIATIADLEGVAPSVYATELAHKWGVGKDGKDNGVLILVKPKTSDSKGEVFIAVGYGLEGAIPDAIASRIIRDVIIPQFQNNDMYGGINEATDMLMGLSSGEYTADEMGGSPEALIGLGSIVFIVIMALSFIFADKISNTLGSDSSTSHIPSIFFGMGGGRSSGGFGGGSSFGGGGFGGGGAGGSW